MSGSKGSKNRISTSITRKNINLWSYLDYRHYGVLIFLFTSALIAHEQKLKNDRALLMEEAHMIRRILLENNQGVFKRVSLVKEEEKLSDNLYEQEQWLVPVSAIGRES